MKPAILILLMLFIPAQLPAMDFSLYKMAGVRPGPTLLVIGGIDGDEPGGFHAAAMLATRYRIKQGQMWIVPNLNFSSIIKRTRGDMNLKFDSLSKSEPQSRQVTRIKALITEPQVDLVLNLHDGSGYYHPQRISQQQNPDRWGQCYVIDQQELPGIRYGNLQALGEAVARQVNRNTLSKKHKFRVKNVRTATSQSYLPAKKSLTYFALRNNKPAFAVEASKNHPVHIRAYYHLLALEAFMEQLKIDFSRDFSLTPEGVKQAIKDDALVSFAGGRIQLELNNLRETITHFPLQKNTGLAFSADNPLVTVLPYRNRFRIHYGNNRLAFLQPQYVEFDKSLSGIEMLIDGQPQKIDFGSIVPVDRTFLVRKKAGYRVNVIGFAKRGYKNDGNLQVDEKSLQEKYSLDKEGKLFRVEVYKHNRFSGMVLVDFRPESQKKQPGSLVAQTIPAGKKGKQLDN